MDTGIESEPLNTEWNRKTKMLPGLGKAMLLLTHNGTAYFRWYGDKGEMVYLKCEENFFRKNFKVSIANSGGKKEGDVKAILAFIKTMKVLNYPFDVVVK